MKKIIAITVFTIVGMFSFTSLAFASTAPTATSSAATAVATSTATLHGSITADGGASSTIEGFNYGTTTAYGSVASSSPGPFNLGTFIQNITGLTPGTTYHFQAFATNASGTGTSSDLTFTASSTVPSAPTSVTAAVSVPSQATVTWTPSFNGGSSTLYFTVISNPAGYTATTSATSTIATGLTNGTSYTFTVSATNAIGVGASSTASNAVIPTATSTVTAQAASSITTTSAVLNGTITATGGASSTVRGFAYGPSGSYGSFLTSSGSFGVGAFTASLSSLVCGGIYHYAPFSVNTSGTSTYPVDTVFTTSACPVTQSTAPVVSSSGGGSISAAQLATILAPSQAASAYLNTLSASHSAAPVVTPAPTPAPAVVTPTVAPAAKVVVSPAKTAPVVTPAVSVKPAVKATTTVIPTAPVVKSTTAGKTIVTPTSSPTSTSPTAKPNKTVSLAPPASASHAIQLQNTANTSNSGNGFVNWILSWFGN